MCCIDHLYMLITGMSTVIKPMTVTGIIAGFCGEFVTHKYVCVEYRYPTETTIYAVIFLEP